MAASRLRSAALAAIGCAALAHAAFAAAPSATGQPADASSSAAADAVAADSAAAERASAAANSAGAAADVASAAAAEPAFDAAGPAIASDAPDAAGAPGSADAVDTGSAAPLAAGDALDLAAGPAAVRNAWVSDAEDSSARIRRTRRTALQLGLWNLDAAARALIGPDLRGTGLEQARAAVALAPDLPAARTALAREIGLEGSSPIAAVRAGFGSLLAIPRHFEASLWFAGTLAYVGALALVVGGLLTLAVYAGASFLSLAHDLGDLVPASLPSFARAALLASALLLPLAAQQGVFGLSLALLAVGLVRPSAGQRLVLCIAAFAIWVGAFPAAQLAGRLIGADADASFDAALSVSNGFAMPADLRRLAAPAARDPIAAMATAITARRAGELELAEARYRELVELDPANPAALNNAANVRLERGDAEGAIALYRRAAQLQDSAVVLFNLSQAQGKAFKLDDHSPTLAAAQRADGDVVAELTLLQGSEIAGFTADLPPPQRALWKRVLATSLGEPLTRELRSALAPGMLGRSPLLALGAIAAVVIASLLGASRWRPSHHCARCGRRMCPRCEPELGRARDCESCNRLFHQPETTDRALRAARLGALRYREQRLARVQLVASVLVPGLAGVFARRPGASLLGALSASLAALAIAWRNGVTPDPLIAGAAAPLAFGSLAALALLAYSASLAFALGARKRG